MFKKFLVIIIIVFLLIFGFYLLKEGYSPEKNSNELIIGTAGNYAPFVSINNDGQYEGFDIDIANELSKRMNKKLVLKDLGSMASLWLALRQEKIDLIIWALSITQEREKEYQMIHYQGQPTKALPLVFWKEIPENIKSLKDFKNFSNVLISVEPASIQEKFLSQFDFIKLKFMEKVSDLIMDIKYGKSTATLVDPSLIDDLKAKYPEIQILWISLPENWIVKGNGIALKKDNVQLGKQIEDIINSMKQDGTINKLEQKWNIKG